MKGRTDVRTYVRTDVDDVMAIKPNFLTSMGYHIFLTMVLHARAPKARAELRYYNAKFRTRPLFTLINYMSVVILLVCDWVCAWGTHRKLMYFFQNK